jgi:hypothetical protein
MKQLFLIVTKILLGFEAVLMGLMLFANIHSPGSNWSTLVWLNVVLILLLISPLITLILSFTLKNRYINFMTYVVAYGILALWIFVSIAKYYSDLGHA